MSVPQPQDRTHSLLLPIAKHTNSTREEATFVQGASLRTVLRASTLMPNAPLRVTTAAIRTRPPVVSRVGSTQPSARQSAIRSFFVSGVCCALTGCVVVPLATAIDVGDIDANGSTSTPSSTEPPTSPPTLLPPPLVAPPSPVPMPMTDSPGSGSSSPPATVAPPLTPPPPSTAAAPPTTSSPPPRVSPTPPATTGTTAPTVASPTQPPSLLLSHPPPVTSSVVPSASPSPVATSEQVPVTQQPTIRTTTTAPSPPPPLPPTLPPPGPDAPSSDEAVVAYNSTTLPPGVDANVLDGGELVSVETTATTRGGQTSISYTIVVKKGDQIETVQQPGFNTTDPALRTAPPPSLTAGALHERQ